MDKRFLKQIEDASLRFVLSHIVDCAELAERRCEARYTQFLTPKEQHFILQYLLLDAGMVYSLFGGWKDAERKILCICPEWLEIEPDSFPIDMVRIQAPHSEGLTHRDYLGALMGLGVKREMIGDILTQGEACFLFCRREICPYICANLEKVGRFGVQAEVADADSLSVGEKKVERSSIPVISMRVDAVLAGVLQLSRSRSAELIRAGRVSVNYELCDSGSHMLCCGDIVSVKGHGKYEIGSMGGTSKKGRTYVEIIKYL